MKNLCKKIIVAFHFVLLFFLLTVSGCSSESDVDYLHQFVGSIPQSVYESYYDKMFYDGVIDKTGWPPVPDRLIYSCDENLERALWSYLAFQMGADSKLERPDYRYFTALLVIEQRLKYNIACVNFEAISDVIMQEDQLLQGNQLPQSIVSVAQFAKDTEDAILIRQLAEGLINNGDIAIALIFLGNLPVMPDTDLIALLAKHTPADSDIPDLAIWVWESLLHDVNADLRLLLGELLYESGHAYYREHGERILKDASAP